jgi:heat shock protein HslJ
MVMPHPGGIFLMDENGTHETPPDRFKTIAGIMLIAVAAVVLLVFLSYLTAQPATLHVVPNWTLVSYRDATGILIPVINTGDITARFEPGGNVTGFSGCNQYVAAYLQNGNAMRITSSQHTTLVCTDPGITLQEETYFTNLAKTASLRTGPSEITVLDAQGTTLLVFQKA